MKKARLLVLLCVPACMLALVAPASAPAAVDMFLQLDGIRGESQDKQFKDQIDVQSFSWGVANGSGKATATSFQDLHVTKRTDVATPELMTRVAGGETIANAVLSVRKASGTEAPQTFFKICLSDVRASSLQSSGGGDELNEAVSLAYGAIAISYARQRADGSLDAPITAGWDVIKGLRTGVTGCQ
jgi:type VI secretion system secreted protein Hcp